MTHVGSSMKPAVEVPMAPEAPPPQSVEDPGRSSSGLARMYEDLLPHSLRVRSAACLLFAMSLFMCGSLEGLFGLIAASSILFCAAPGSLGVAYASRCARIAAVIAASIGIMHLFALAAVSLAVLPSMPAAAQELCTREAQLHPDAPALKLVAPDVAPDWVGASNAPVATPPSSSTMIASVASAAARKLEEVMLADGESPASEAAHCARIGRFFQEMAPTLLLGCATIEACLVFAALRLAYACAAMVRVARQMGANAL